MTIEVLDGSKSSLLGLNVLIFGGTSFMGKSLVAALQPICNRIHLINRGRTYWDLPIASLCASYKNISYAYGNRSKKSFRQAINDSIVDGTVWDMVVDFSAFNVADMVNIKDIFNHCLRYIFISSDSVYEVCRDDAINGVPCVTENSSIRPELYSERKQLREDDEYGDDKLLCEEWLKENVASCTTFCLRLADVIGPFDDTLRLYALLCLARTSIHTKMGKVLLPPSEMNRKTDLTFSSDVTNVIIAILQMETCKFHSNFNVYNICCTSGDASNLWAGGPTLKEIIESKGGLAEWKKDRNTANLLPSIDRRFSPLSSEKVTAELRVSLSCWRDAVDAADNFLMQTLLFQNEDELVEMLTEKIPRAVSHYVLEWLEEVYSSKMGMLTDFSPIRKKCEDVLSLECSSSSS